MRRPRCWAKPASPSRAPCGRGPPRGEEPSRWPPARARTTVTIESSRTKSTGGWPRGTATVTAFGRNRPRQPTIPAQGDAMTKTIARFLFVAAVAAVGCSSRDPRDVTTPPQPLATDNGLWQNGRTTNGLSQDGLWQNGLWQNGLWQNGLWQNGLWQNGLWQNGLWQNGLWQNGVGTNGLWQNGLWQNGLWQNGLT